VSLDSCVAVRCEQYCRVGCGGV